MVVGLLVGLVVVGLLVGFLVVGLVVVGLVVGVLVVGAVGLHVGRLVGAVGLVGASVS